MKPLLNEPKTSTFFLHATGKIALFLFIVLICYILRGIQIPEQFTFLPDPLPEGATDFQMQNRILLVLFLLCLHFFTGKRHQILFRISPLKRISTYFWILGLLLMVILLLHKPLTFHLLPFKFMDYIQLLIITCILVPIEEELFYRGILLLIPYRQLRYVMLIISSLLFAFTHSAAFSALLLGLVLGTLALRFRNLLVPILAHFLWNLFSLFF